MIRESMRLAIEVDDPPETPGVVEPKTAKRTRPRTKRQPPYAVILHNDPFNGMDFVVGVLKKVFGYSTQKSVWLMMKAHFTGSVQVWSGVLEVAELKADQIRSCGPDPVMASRGAQRLNVSLEPLE